MASNNLVELNSGNFADIISSDMPVLVDFWAPWCGPCRMLGPIIEEIAEETAGRYTICKLNVDDNGDLAAKYRVMSIPTVYVFKNGQAVNSFVGIRSKTEIMAMLDNSVSA